MTREEINSATPEWLNRQVEMVMGYPHGTKYPVKDIRDAFLLEEKVKEMGMQGKYCDELDAICCQMEGLKFDFWNCIHATPEQRTKAFLLAMMEIKVPPKSDWEELADICSESARKAGLTQERSRELLQEAREILKPGD